MKDKNKALVIHMNRFLYRNPLEHYSGDLAPSFYAWLAEARGMKREYFLLEEAYKKGMKSGPLLLRETYELVTRGLSEEDFNYLCHRYHQSFFSQAASSALFRISHQMQVLILGSYPKEVYETWEASMLAEKVFGAEAVKVNRMITSLKKIFIAKPELVFPYLQCAGYGDKPFPDIPHRWGLLALLVDYAIQQGISPQNITVLGKGETSEPLQRFAGRTITDINDL